MVHCKKWLFSRISAWKTHWRQALLLSASVSLFVTTILPLQSFLCNRSLYNFELMELLGESGMFFIMVSCSLFLILSVLSVFFGRFFHVILLGFFVYEYLETGLLSIGLPPLNGELDCFGDTVRKFIDTCIWGGLVLSFAVAYRYVKHIIHFVCWAMLILMCASLFDVHKEGALDVESPLSSGFCPKEDVIKSVSFSTNKNVLAICLDATSASVAAGQMRENPALAERFKGFTAYENDVAMHEITVRAVPGYVTGEYLEKGLSSVEYLATMWGPNSFIMPYLNEGSSVYFCPGTYNYGYTNKRSCFSEPRINKERKGFAFLRPTLSIPYPSLLEVVRFRLTPCREKRGVLARLLKRAKTVDNDMYEEDNAFPLLKVAGVSGDKSVLFHIHTKGTHMPILHDRHGVPYEQPRGDMQALKEFTWYQLSRVADVFDTLKSKGIYDKSMIVLFSDHGNPIGRENPKVMGQAKAMLWVKPIGCQQDFAISEIPVSHCKIAPLIKESASRDLSSAEVANILLSHNRLFRGKFDRTPFITDWVYDDTGQAIKMENRGVFSGN